MMRFICCPPASIPSSKEHGIEYISLYETAILTRFDVGDVAISLKQDIRRSGINPSIEAWDFCSIAMSVAAVDETAPRKESADGWTRVLAVEIHIYEPLVWQNQIPALERALKLLTGDFWQITITDGGDRPPSVKNIKAPDADCVSLLSGGVDSLIGAIDLQRSGRKPLFVSKLVKGNGDFQMEVARRLGDQDCHVQWSFNSRSKSSSESSTRGRSLIFFAYAALVASFLHEQKGGGDAIEVFVPENGFISLNLPLTPLRIGTLSTKTTHPVFLEAIQQIWNATGIRAILVSPFEYRFRTKGEMLLECLDKDLLLELIGRSTSCGRYAVYNRTHCGRCVPCMVRRSAFLRGKFVDTTTVSTYKGIVGQYVFEDLAVAAKEDSANDIRAIGRACLQVKEEGIGRFINHGLAFCSPNDRPKYVNLVARGIEELSVLMKYYRLL